MESSRNADVQASATADSVSGVVGLDLGDKKSRYHLLDRSGKTVGEGSVATHADALRMLFSGTEKKRIVIECGTHSPWVSRLLKELGHEVIVANPRRLHLISESNKKNDRTDAELLAKLGHGAPDLLSPVHHRDEQIQFDLCVIKARDAAVLSRARLVTAIRGIVKSAGGRLAMCSTGVFPRKALDGCPSELQAAIQPLLRIVEQLTAEIRGYDRLIQQKAQREYPATASLLTIPGVGPLTALTFVLLLNNDPDRFSKSRDLGCYFGLQPKQQDSGKHVSQLGITKAGDNLMRKLAVQCAHFMLGRFGKDTALKRWGLELSLRGGKNAKKRAVVAVARKLLVLMHRLWRTNTTFVPFPSDQIQAQTAA